MSASTLQFTSGSNGLAMYANNCSYSNDNRKNLPWQLSDEADCGAVCAVTSTCAYFTFAKGTCYLYSLANPSSKVVPLPSTSTSFSSCGYVTSKKTPVPTWKTITNNGPLNLTVTTAPNCGYIGTDPNDIEAQSNLVVSLNEPDCRITCATASTCTQYRWTNGTCLLMQLVKPVTYYSVSGSCGYVSNRQTVSFTNSGSNGMVRYSTNCDYISDNRKILASFTVTAFSTKDYEDDCGTACAYTPFCSYFAFMYGYCNLYAIANTSLPVPKPYTTTYYSSCGYVFRCKIPAIKWKSTSNGQIMSAKNCTYIGLDPADAQIQSQNVQSLSEEDCGSMCAATSTCSYYRWDRSSEDCHLMSIVKPVAKPTTSPGSCGYVVNRKPITWTTNGQMQTNSNCTFTYWAYVGYGLGNDLNACAKACSDDSKCSLFNLSGPWCNLITFTGEPLAIYSSSTACGKRISPG